MLASFLFTKSFGQYGNKKVNYSRYSMLYSPLVMAVTLEDHYLSIKDKYQTYYGISSYLFTSLTVTDTIE